jgi:transcriptional regulator with XRE-family HTH domain
MSMGSLPNDRRTRQSKPFDGLPDALSTEVDTVLALLRVCVQDAGWTLDALEAEMKLDKSLISRVLNGERPLTLRFLLALPDDIESRFEQLRAEQFGHIVVAPVSGADAIRNLVSGLIGVLAPQLPARATAMAKATLPTVTEPVLQRRTR